VCDSAAVCVTLLGSPQITVARHEIAGGLRKARELLAFLAVHPDGATGDQVSEALWPGAPPGHGTAQRNIAVRKLREMLRTATGRHEAMFITLTADRYRLDPAMFDIDIWRFQRSLLEARNASGEDAQLAACLQAVDVYKGPLADSTGYDWAEPYAEQARRRALDAWTRIAEITASRDPEQALAALETALGHDPYNEFVYQKIMRLQAAAGRPDAIRRTLSLLETRLTELGVTPSPQTRTLAASLLGSTTTVEPPRRSEAPLRFP
jgi:DNA-binding SARP family transcriptional activator